MYIHMYANTERVYNTLKTNTLYIISTKIHKHPSTYTPLNSAYKPKIRQLFVNSLFIPS